MAISTSRRRLSALARREAILAAAKPVFGSAGYHAATTREIAAAAGISEALLYQHFPGKRELFEAVIERAAADLESRLCQADGAADPVRAAVQAYFDFVQDESALYRVFFHEALQSDPAFGRLHRDISRRILELVEGGIGELAEAPPGARLDVVAQALAGMVSQLALWWVEDRGLAKREIVERAARMARAIYMTEATHGYQAD